MGLEELIIRIQYIMSTALNIPHIRPTIILIEQFPFAAGYPLQGHDVFPSEQYHNHDYAVIYENLAKHYNLLLWSIRDVYWSYYDSNIDIAYRYPIDVLGSNPMHHYFHIPWFANLYIADLLAGCFLHVMKSIETSSANRSTHTTIISKNVTTNNSSSYRDYESIIAAYPKPLYISSLNSYCDDMKPYLLHYEPSSQFHPHNLTEYENKITDNNIGWREYIDYYNVSGYTSLRSLTFKFNFQPPIEYLSNQQLLNNWLSKYILKISYLESYENMGIVKVILCGIDILVLDGLHKDYQHYKVSIPQFIIYNRINDVCTINTLDKFQITFQYMQSMDQLSIRKLSKFKLIEADMCEYAKVV